MQIDKHEAHLWLIDLTQSFENDWDILDNDEQTRANQFIFPIHKKRFVCGRAMLRRCLAEYLTISPQNILFEYGDHGKPRLATSLQRSLHFNISHSHDLAVFTFIENHEIGIDVELIKNKNLQEVAERFFSEAEIHALHQANALDKINMFYRIWARKEALIKAIGKGLTIPLDSFSVSTLPSEIQQIKIDKKTWSIIPLNLHQKFESALATESEIHTLSYWQFAQGKAILEKQCNI